MRLNIFSYVETPHIRDISSLSVTYLANIFSQIFTSVDFAYEFFDQAIKTILYGQISQSFKKFHPDSESW